MGILSSHFVVVEAHAIEDYWFKDSKVVNWLAQLSKGPFYGRTEALLHPELSITRRYSNQTILEIGQLPPALTAFSFHGEDSALLSRGIPLMAGETSSVRGGSAFEIITPRDSQYTTLSITETAVANHSDGRTLRRFQSLHGEECLVRLTTQQPHNQLYLTINRILDQILAEPELADDDAYLVQAHRELVQALAELLHLSEPVPLRLNARSKLLQRALTMIHETPRHQITIDNLARAIGTSRRNMEIAFNQALKLSPKEYIKHLKLNRVRCELLTRQHTPSTITEIAQRFGFIHLGHFSRSYAALFNELPSETLKRSKASKVADELQCEPY